MPIVIIAYNLFIINIFIVVSISWFAVNFQGSRLTAFELVHEKIPSTLIADSAAAALMKQGHVQAVIVGADRIAANGKYPHHLTDQCKTKYSHCWLCFLHKISRWHGQQDWHIQPCHLCKASWCPVLCRSASNFHWSRAPIWGRNCHRGKVAQGVAELWRWSWKASCCIWYISLEPSFRCYSSKPDYCNHNREGMLLPTSEMFHCVHCPGMLLLAPHLAENIVWYAVGWCVLSDLFAGCDHKSWCWWSFRHQRFHSVSEIMVFSKAHFCMTNVGAPHVQ